MRPNRAVISSSSSTTTKSATQTTLPFARQNKDNNVRQSTSNAKDDDDDVDDNLTHIYSWTDTIVLWQEKDTKEYLFEVDRIEYSLGAYTFTEYSKNDMDIDEVRSICDDMQIEYVKSNTQQQLIQKMFKEVKSKIPQQ